MIVSKLWGTERILHNGPDYCMKVLTIEPGFQSSLHYHRQKRETFLVTEGLVLLELGLVRHFMSAGMHMTVEPGTVHRFCSGDRRCAVVIEASTEHREDDVVRLEPSAKQENK